MGRKFCGPLFFAATARRFRGECGAGGIKRKFPSLLLRVKKGTPPIQMAQPLLVREAENRPMWRLRL